MAIGTTSTRTSSTPSFPIPASARVRPATRSPSSTTTAAGLAKANATAKAKAITPATATPGKASTPTTTYVPAGRTPLPGIKATGAGATGAPAKSTALGLVPHKRSQRSSTLSTGAIAIAVLAALLVLACLGWALARRRAFEPHWMLSLRHAIAEAGFRLSATCAEFADWVRLGH
jgi:hypothetical protein